MSNSTEKAFWEDDIKGFGTVTEADDSLHPHLSELEPGYALTETQYLGFNIPEHNIHAIGYMWYHPHLKTVMGGIAVWQGFTNHPLQSPIWDYVSYMSDECFVDPSLSHYQLENSYQVSVIKPLKEHRIQYHNEKTDSYVDVKLEALTPPVMLDTGMHFEQAMKTSGEVKLLGKTYQVNGTTVRDRSFGQLRHEYLVPLPPLAWMNCGFNENFAFGCTAFDDPSRGAVDWAGKMSLPGGQAMRGGWIYKAGVLSPLVSASKYTIRKQGGLYADRVELTMTDANGRTFEVVGVSCAGVNWRTWHNMDSNINLMRWECDGLVAYGDYQEFLWPEYIRKCL